MSKNNSSDDSIKDLPVEINRDSFLTSLALTLGGSLENAIGYEEASSFISMAGQEIGDWMNKEYKKTLNQDEFDVKTLANILVDLKRRIQGDFYIIEFNEDKIVLGNRSCPFGKEVKGHPTMCMMTSNVFGVIAAESFDYAKVSLEKTIAQGQDECRVIIYLKQTEETKLAYGHEYYRA